MWTWEQAYNLIWVLLGTSVCFLSGRLGLWDGSSGPGNGFIPFLSGLLIGCVGLTMFLLELRRPHPQQHLLPSRTAALRIALVLGGLCFVAVALSTLGFLISAFLTTAVLLRAIERQKWWVMVLIALVSCLAAYVLFDVLLQVPLPRGPFGL